MLKIVRMPSLLNVVVAGLQTLSILLSSKKQQHIMPTMFTALMHAHRLIIIYAAVTALQIQRECLFLSFIVKFLNPLYLSVPISAFCTH